MSSSAAATRRAGRAANGTIPYAPRPMWKSIGMEVPSGPPARTAGPSRTYAASEFYQAPAGSIPYVMTAAEIMRGDCLDVMWGMPDNSIDLIIASPPRADDGTNAPKHAGTQTYGIIHPDRYVAWFLPRAGQKHRILKPTGSLILHIKEGVSNGQRQTYVLELILALRAAGFRWTEEYIWHKTAAEASTEHAPSHQEHRFVDAWERLLHFTKSPNIRMNQDAVRVPVGGWTRTRLKKMSGNDRRRVQSATNVRAGRRMANWAGREWAYPSNVLYGAPARSHTGRDAALPEWLAEFFIRLFTDEGDVVLDPFAQSGTVVRVTTGLGRTPIGIDVGRDGADVVEKPDAGQSDVGLPHARVQDRQAHS